MADVIINIKDPSQQMGKDFEVCPNCGAAIAPAACKWCDGTGEDSDRVEYADPLYYPNCSQCDGFGKLWTCTAENCEFHQITDSHFYEAIGYKNAADFGLDTLLTADQGFKFEITVDINEWEATDEYADHVARMRALYVRSWNKAIADYRAGKKIKS